MIYGSGQAQSALGSLLRKIQEESSKNPAKIPVAAAESSPIRQQIQGPLESPESAGSDKVVALKPELNPSSETPSPVGPTNTPIDPAAAGAAMVAGGASPIVAAKPVVLPQSSPQGNTGITPPTSSKVNNTPSPGVVLPNASIGSNKPTTTQSSLATTLLPSSLKSSGVGTKAPTATPTPTPQKNTQTSSQSGASMAIKELLPTLSKLLQRSVLGVGTIMQQSTINKAIERLMYGGKKVSRT